MKVKTSFSALNKTILACSSFSKKVKTLFAFDKTILACFSAFVVLARSV